MIGWTLAAVVAVACAALGAVCAWLFADRRAVRAERERLAGELERCDGVRQKLGDENRDLLARLERADADAEAARAQVERERAVAEDRVAELRRGFDTRLGEARREFEQLQKQAKDTFANLAGEALKGATAEFLTQARAAFEGQKKLEHEVWERRQGSIESMVRPIRETLAKHEQAVTEVERARNLAYGDIKQQVVAMQEAQARLQSETRNLVTALRRPEVRGQWGEIQLRRIVELAGMVPHCDFDEQVVVKSVDGAKKPDMVVRLPGGKTIAVDAKTPMVAILDALECDDDETRAECVKRHLGHIHQKVRDLSAKRYQDQFDGSPDFVVLFIHTESFLQPAVQLEPGLIERAMNLGVVIATPTTLISLLKAVAMGWREERVAENAKKISDLGVELHRRIATALDHLTRLGRSLDSTVENYNKLVGSVESSVLPQARRFKELHADSPKELPEVQLVEVMPREVRAAEVG